MKNEDQRIKSVDAARGLIMVIMAMDHVIYFLGRFHPAEFWNLPPPQFPNAAFEAIRFLTHLCAPGFVLFAGMSLAFASARGINAGATTAGLRRRILIRAALLFVLVQLVLETLAWAPGSLGGRGIPMNEVVIPGAPGLGPFSYFGVIFAIAASLALCSLFLSASNSLVAVAAAIAVLASPVALLVGPEATEPINPVLGPLLYPGLSLVYTAYPLFPWVGVMLVGMLVGRRLARGFPARKLLLPAAVTIAFGIALRFVIPFGESTPMVSGRSFFDLSKYPPSLAFLGIMVGLNLASVALFDLWFHGAKRTSVGWALRGLGAFGREPLVFYLGHLYLYAGLCYLLVFPGSVWPLVAVWAASLVPLYALVQWYHRVRTMGRLPRLLARL